MLMYSCPSGMNTAIPQEYWQAAEALFPPDGFPKDPDALASGATGFAEILGIGSDYRRLLDAGNSSDMRKFFGHFRNNLDLLIQKTWVEKADETRKYKLQERIPSFIRDIEAAEYRKALLKFSSILDELSYLLFGTQSNKEDFIEYALRIDLQMGLFWWYGSQLEQFLSISSQEATQARQDDVNENCRAILLIGMCYLTNF